MMEEDRGVDFAGLLFWMLLGLSIGIALTSIYYKIALPIAEPFSSECLPTNLELVPSENFLLEVSGVDIDGQSAP